MKKIQFIVFILPLFLALFGCQKTEPISPLPTPTPVYDHVVIFIVQGTGASGSYAWNGLGTSQTGSFASPTKMVSTLLGFPPGSYISISATVTSGTGTVTVTIIDNGTAYSNTSASGAGSVAFLDRTL